MILAASLEALAILEGIDAWALSSVVASLTGLAGLYVGKTLEKRKKR
jgi:hypothetical protein